MGHEQGKIINFPPTDVDTFSRIVGVPIDDWQLHLNELEASILQIPIPCPGGELPEDIAIEMALQVRKLRIVAGLVEFAIQVPQETREQRLQTLKYLSDKGIVKTETIEWITSIYGTSSSEASPAIPVDLADVISTTTITHENQENGAEALVPEIANPGGATSQEKGADGETVTQHSEKGAQPDNLTSYEKHAAIVANALINNFPQQSVRRLTTSDIYRTTGTTVHPSRFIDELKNTLEAKGYHLREIPARYKRGKGEKEYAIESKISDQTSGNPHSPQIDVVIFSNPVSASAHDIAQAAVNNGVTRVSNEPDSGVKKFKRTVGEKIRRAYEQTIEFIGENNQSLSGDISFSGGKLSPQLIRTILNKYNLLEAWKKLDPAFGIPFSETMSMHPLGFAFLFSVLRNPEIANRPELAGITKRELEELLRRMQHEQQLEVDFTGYDLVNLFEDDYIGDIDMGDETQTRKKPVPISRKHQNRYLKRFRLREDADDK